MVKPTLKDIESFISDIPDPEIPVITIKELGILRGIDFVANNYVITITPTYTGCPAMGLLEDTITQELNSHGVLNVQVKLVYSPAWTTDWLSEETKDKLRKYGIAPPKHSACFKSGDTESKIHCPRCNSLNTQLISRFGSTACKSLYSCLNCKEPFEYFKCH